MPASPPPGPSEPLPLTRLPRHRPARIQTVSGGEDFRRRLFELGLVPGARVTVLRVAPLGDPLELEVRGARMSVRRQEAAEVQVVPCSSAENPGREPLGRGSASGTSGRVVLLGNPRSGRRVVARALQVAETPGATAPDVVMTPGVYTVNARNRREQRVLDLLLGRGSPPPQVVLVVLDATALQRSLYLLLQVQEFGLPTAAVLTRDPEARIHLQALSEHLGLPIRRFGPRQSESHRGLRALVEEAGTRAGDSVPKWHWEPDADLARHLDELAPAAESLAGRPLPRGRARAVALWCLSSLQEDDELEGIPQRLRRQALDLRRSMEAHGHDLDLEVTRARYDHIEQDLLRFASPSGPPPAAGGGTVSTPPGCTSLVLALLASSWLLSSQLP